MQIHLLRLSRVCVYLFLMASLLVVPVATVTADHLRTPHPTPLVQPFDGCPPEGVGGDPGLNYLKNRIDVPRSYEDWTVDQLLDLPYPPDVGRRRRANWPSAAKEVVQRYEGAPVRVVGYLIRQRKQGAESTNCGSTTSVDWHFWISAERGQLQAQSVVAEPTPRVLDVHPNWRPFLRSHKLYAEGDEPRIRLVGWLLFDQDHPEQLLVHRGTLWEIHPVTRIEVWDGSQWMDLDRTP